MLQECIIKFIVTHKLKNDFRSFFLDSAACQSVKSDVVFVLDSSSTVCTQLSGSTCANWTNVLNFVVSIVDQMNISPDLTRVGVVRFASAADSVFYLNSYNRYNLLKILRIMPNRGLELSFIL